MLVAAFSLVAIAGGLQSSWQYPSQSCSRTARQWRIHRSRIPVGEAPFMIT